MAASARLRSILIGARRTAGLDFHVSLTLLLRVWSILAGAMMVVCVTRWFSPAEQGYYYTFSSLLALQIFFELGLNQVVVQLVSHEMAHLRLQPNGEILGDPRHIDRIRSVLTLLRRWYAVAAVLFLVCVAAAGMLMFSRNGAVPASAWAGPWIALVAMTSVNLFFSPMLAVMEGCNQVGQVARLRLMQSVLGYSLTWIALFAGAGFWAIPLTAGTACVCTALWLRARGNILRAFDNPEKVPPDRAVDWKREVLPFQWRIAVSWVSGYLIFQLFTPLVFVNLGAAAAGRLGIALAIFSALLSVGVSWVNAKLPALTTSIARDEREQLNQVFRAVMIRAFGFTTVCSVVVLLAIAVLRAMNLPVMERLADMPTLVCIATATCANVLVHGLASYMRAHREEPMLPVSVVGGVLTLGAAYFASRHGAFPTMLVQAVIVVLVSLPWTVYLFKGYYSRREASNS